MVLRNHYYRSGHSDVKARKSTFFKGKRLLRTKSVNVESTDYTIKPPVSILEKILRAVLLLMLFGVIGSLCYMVGVNLAY